jgi:osmotically-inducible protein OsmY
MFAGDLPLKGHVEAELNWEPRVNAAAIGVAVQDAVVTLSGHVDSFAQKHAAEEVVMRIHGVRALANNLEVRVPGDGQRTDDDIARAVSAVFHWNSLIPHEQIKVIVANSWVTLQGVVDWDYQRRLAERTVREMMGVKGVSNQITLKPRAMQADIKARIESALKRDAEINADHISLLVSGSKVTLLGAVQSLATREAAERAAWNAPGITSVENNVTIDPNIEAAHFA